MEETVKVRLRRGTREIEIEGSPGTVEGLLQKWWTGSEDVEDSEPGSNGDGQVGKSKKGRSRTNKRSSESETDAFDAQAIVNKLRNDERFELFEKRVLHQRNQLNKIKLVCWSAGQPLTSGQIHRILTGLGVRTGLSNISMSIKAGISDFIQDGERVKGAIVRYHLTGQAARKFSEWLQQDE